MMAFPVLRGRPMIIGLVIIVLLVALSVSSPGTFAADPDGGTVSSDTPTVEWTGGPFLTSNPTVGLFGLHCLEDDPACDTFALTVARPLPQGDFVVDVSIDGEHDDDDYDLYVFGPDDNLLAQSTTPSGNESVRLFNPEPATYEVVAVAWEVLPGSTYRGKVAIESVPKTPPKAKAFKATKVKREVYEAGTPRNEKTHFPGQPLKVDANEVGREAAEPTIGVTPGGTAFFAAATFDSAIPALARTEILRSRDDGQSWESVQQVLLADTSTEPPTTLDPYLHVDPETGRVFTIDLYAGCSYLLFSADEGETWTRNPTACGQPVNDHHTINTGPPVVGDLTVGYPNVLYYCFNRVSDSSCGKSLDGGQTFLPAGTAFLGEDPEAGGFCGGLHGHLATDSDGRVFLPKGHCDFPWIAISEDGAVTFSRVQINDYIPTPHHEVSLAVDSANNIYAVWQETRDRLPYLSVSTDHGRSWSTPVMIAPPGVLESPFPTIAAGHAGRIAVHFPGTTVDGRGDTTRPWNIYELVSVNALDPEPTFVWTTANDPREPVHRGNCGPGRCGGMFDFLDIQTSPVDGAFWAAASDTCVGECIDDPHAGTLLVGEGVAIRQSGGPALWATQKKP